MESMVSAALILLLVRTRGPFFHSRPSAYLMLATLLVVVFTIALPYTLLADTLGLAPVPPVFFLALFAITALYVLCAAAAKRVFHARWRRHPRNLRGSRSV